MGAVPVLVHSLRPCPLLQSAVGWWGGWGRRDSVLLRLQLPSPPRLSQGWAVARRVAAFPGPVRAVSTFLISWVHQGLAKPGVLCPAQAPTCRPASSAPWPCKERVWQPPGLGCGNCLPCMSLLGRVRAAVPVGGQPAGLPAPTTAGAVGTPLLTPSSPNPLPLHLENWRLRLKTGCGLGL